MGQYLGKILAFLLAAALLSGAMAGCLLRVERGEADTEDPGGSALAPGVTDLDIPCDDRLSISFVPGDSLNPYTSASRDNLAVAGLIYEGLFALGEGFTAVPVIAEGMTTLDGRRYTIQIRRGITFHGGARLTVEDVIYSLNRARESPLFAGRLALVSFYERRVDAEGVPLDYELDILLNRTHGNVAVLLTFPIIRQGSTAYTVPPGTGPYQFTDAGGPPRLIGFPAHRHGDALPIDTIHLREVVSFEQMTAHFNSGYLDIVALELTATGEPRFALTREIRHFEASLMDFVGFNLHRPETGRAEVRQAISFAIDRAYITDNIMRGNAVASPLPLHPALFYYDRELAAAFAFDLPLARRLLTGETAFDSPARPSDPGAQEAYPAENGAQAQGPGAPPTDTQGEDEDEPPPIQLTLLVASGSTNRMEVAVYIAAGIAELGYEVIIDDRPYEAFMQALENGDFDLFYGQVRLQPDFDLTELLFGGLHFGGRGLEGDIIDPRLLDDFLASGQSDRGDWASRMCLAILTEAPFAVIGFRHLSVATQRGVVTGMQPTQENVYNNIWEWRIQLPSNADIGE